MTKHVSQWTIRIVSAAVLIVLLVLVTAVALHNRDKEILNADATETLQKNISVELKEYFGQYLTNQKGEIKELSKTVDTIQDSGAIAIDLTPEQQEILISEILKNLTPEKLSEITNQSSLISEKAINNLETDIYNKLVEKFSTYYEEAKLTDSQIEAIADAVTVIVEKNLYDELEKRFANQEKYLVQIEKAITEKLDKVTNTVTKYQETVKELETKIKVVEKDSSSTEEVEKLRDQITNLQNSFTAFVSTAQPAINIVTNLSVKPTGDNDVLSAQAGYNLNEKISSLNTTLTNAYNDFATTMTQKVNDNDKKQSQKLADAKQDLESQIADNAEKAELMNKAREAAEKALESKSKQDIANLEDALESLGSDISDDLKRAYDELVAADSADKDALEKAIESAKSSLNSDIEQTNNNITSLQADLTNTKNNLSNELTNTKKDLSNEITKMGEDVNNKIIAKMPTYMWSEGGNHLTISIPKQ